MELSLTPPLMGSGNGDCLLDTLLSDVDMVGKDAEVRSNLLPARRSVRFGEASARASLRKVGRALNEACDATSYTKSAPAAPR